MRQHSTPHFVCRHTSRRRDYTRTSKHCVNKPFAIGYSPSYQESINNSYIRSHKIVSEESILDSDGMELDDPELDLKKQKGYSQTNTSPVPMQIHYLAERCRDELDQSSLKIWEQEGKTNDSPQWLRLRDLRGRFDMWAAGTNAFVPDEVNLSYRLRDLPDISEAVSDHLESILRQSEACKYTKKKSLDFS